MFKFGWDCGQHFNREKQVCLFSVNLAMKVKPLLPEAHLPAAPIRPGKLIRNPQFFHGSLASPSNARVFSRCQTVHFTGSSNTTHLSSNGCKKPYLSTSAVLPHLLQCSLFSLLFIFCSPRYRGHWCKISRNETGQGNRVEIHIP